MFEQYETRVNALNEPSMLSSGKRGQAMALLNLGRADEALMAAREAAAIAIEYEETYNEIEALQVLAQIHSRYTLPLPEHTNAPNAALHYLNRALELAATIDGYIVPGNMYDAIAREYARIGDYAQAYALSLQAIAAREKTNSAEAINRAVAMQIRHQTDQARSEAAHHRQLAEAEARRAEALQQMTTTLERLSAIGQEITAQLDVTAIFEMLNRHVHGLLDATHFSVFLLDPDGIALDCVFGIEEGKPLPALRVNLAHPSANVARCARERSEIIRDRAATGFNPNHIPGTLPSSSALFAPLQVGSRLLGVMSIQSPHAQAYAERERLIFRTLCAYGAIALDNASAYRQLEASHKALGEAQAQLVEKNRELKNAYNEQYPGYDAAP
jgi:putative methionine-R-sulfoxide reductase with GAF domain